MININKKREPIEFTNWKRDNKNVYNLEDYEGDALKIITSTVKIILQKALCEEQGHLCCYCMGRISPDGKHMRVEHCISQNDSNPHKFKYSNLLAACCGNEGYKGNVDSEEDFEHCDKKKGERPLKFNPAKGNVERNILYQKDGVISSRDEEFSKELNEMLNLNWKDLKDERKAVWKGIENVLRRGRWTLRQIENKIAECEAIDSTHKLKPYCGVMLYYLKQRRTKLQAQSA